MSVSALSVYGASPGAFGLPMPAETTEKAKPESWVDWLPAELSDPEQFITREELLAQLEAEDVAVSARTLMFWEAEGLLPRPIRKWVGDKTRALYPPEVAASAVRHLRQLQDEGLPLRMIGARMRTYVRLWTYYDTATPDRIAADRARVGPSDVKEAVDGALALLARWHAQRGRIFPHMRIVATDTNGEPHTLWDFPLTDYQ